MSTPNTCVGRRRSASSSSDHGIAEESTATPNPAAKSAGLQQRRAGARDPERESHARSDSHGEDETRRTSEGLPHPDAQQDVGAPEDAGSEGERDAGRIEPFADPRCQERDAGGGHGDPEEVTRAPRADERDAERPDELERHGDPERDAVERLEEAEVHRDEHEAERHGEPKLGPRPVPDPRAKEQAEDEPAEDEP